MSNKAEGRITMNDQSLPLDFYINVTVSNDKLTASIHFTNCDEDFKCTKASLMLCLKQT